MWMHCQAGACGRLFRVERDLVKVSCPECGRGPIRAATGKHAAMAEKCGVVKVTVTTKKKG